MTTWLHEERLAAVEAELLAGGAARILDLGCGDGALLLRLACAPQVRRIVGIDLSAAALARLRGRLAALSPSAEVTLVQGSLTDADPAHAGFDAAALVETIEHLDPAGLSALERALFARLRPGRVVLTTPNAEFNPLLGVPAHRLRHPGHRFEWPRARFRRWAEGVAERHGYAVACRDIGGRHPDLGGASQMAVFRRAGP